MAEPAKTPEPPKREELAKLIEREDAELQAAEAKAKADAKAKAAAAAKAKEAEAKAVADAKAQAETDAKAKAEAEAKLVAEAKAKTEADAKAKAEADAKAKAVAQAKAKADAEAKAKKQAELAQKFNAGDISKLLASKEPSQSMGSTGREVQRTASLGTATGNAQKLNPSMRDALAGMLQSQIEKCYVAPPGAAGSHAVLPVLNIQFGPDGTLSPEPRIIRSGPSPLDRSVAEAALRAVRRCAPYKIPAQYAPYYNDWKNTVAQFELPQV
jgi:colicin import membrane protein